MEFALVFGEDYNVKGSDFIVFDQDHLFPMDMHGVSDGVQMRDFYYYPIDPPPLPVTIPSSRSTDDADWENSEDKEFIFFRRNDTGEHFQDIVIQCPSHNKFQIMVNTDYKNYTKEKWDWKSSIPIQTRKDCNLYKKGTETGPDKVDSSAKKLLVGSLGIICMVISYNF